MKKIFAVMMAVVLMMFTAIPAFATDVISPSATDEFDIIVNNTVGGTGSYVSEIIDGKKYVTLTAETEDGHTFTRWEITGDYEIVEGTLESEELVIILGDDCVATPIFDEEAIKPTQNTGSTSPQTSDSSSYVFLLIGLFVAVAGATGVKIAKAKK